jgi:sortase A
MTAVLAQPAVEPVIPPSSSHRAAAPSSGAAVIILRSLYALAALMIWFVAYALVFGAVQESRSQSVLYAQFRQQLAGGTAPAGGLIAPGQPVAVLDIPRLGIHDVVVEGTSPGNLLLGPGHRADSPLPGEVGVSVLYGRAAAFGAPFRQLTKLRPGDAITVTDGAGIFKYIVEGVRRAGSPLPAPVTGAASRLTLASATGVGWRSVLAPSAPVYADALMQGDASAEPDGRVGGVAAADKLMGVDGSALASLVRWLQLLALTAIGSAVLYTRWGRWQTWIVAVPTVGAALWIVTETAFRLLPNAL